LVVALQTDAEIYIILDGYRGGTGSRMRATLLAHRESGNLDAAVLKIQREAGCVEAELGNPPALGGDVLALGFPWGKAMTLASGIVSQVPLEESDSRLMIAASVSYDVSGGGVYDAGGHLIGIVEGYQTAQPRRHSRRLPDHPSMSHSANDEATVALIGVSPVLDTTVRAAISVSVVTARWLT
jgi:hypothetical protein